MTDSTPSGTGALAWLDVLRDEVMRRARADCKVCNDTEAAQSPETTAAPAAEKE